MRKIIYVALVAVVISCIGCSGDDGYDAPYHYSHVENLLVHAHKEHYYYTGTSILSTEKGYVVTDEEGRTYTIPVIEGFDGIYKEGREYLISVAVYVPSKDLVDAERTFKFISVIEEREPQK